MVLQAGEGLGSPHLVPPVFSVLGMALHTDDTWLAWQTKPSQVKLSRQIKYVFPLDLEIKEYVNLVKITGFSYKSNE